MRADKLRIYEFLTNKYTDFKEMFERADGALNILSTLSHKLHYSNHDFQYL